MIKENLTQEMMALRNRFHSYLSEKGIKKNSNNESIFTTNLGKKIINIASVYISASEFKEELLKKPLIIFLNEKYSKTEEQLVNLGYNKENTLIFMITNIEGTHEPWFDHEKINGLHPLENFVRERNITTILIGQNSVYEPDLEALKK